MSETEVGTRVRQRRLAAGVTQAEVAAVLGIDASAVSRVEKGDRHLSAFELGLLAQAFGWDARELLGIERPRRKMAVAARLREVDGSPQHALARAADVVEVDGLLDDLGVGDDSTGLLFDVPLPPPTSVESASQQGVELAEMLRDKVGVVGPLTDLVGFAEHELGVDVLVASVAGGCDGVIAVGDRVAVAVVDDQVVSGRQRFTLAHEIGHAIMGDVVDSVYVDRGNGDRHLVETRADAFAANLLMPAPQLTALTGARPGAVELTEAMVTFGVSWTALLRRCDDLKVTVGDDLRSLSGADVFALAGRSVEVTRVEVPIPVRIPARVDRRVRRAYGDALIGSRVVGIAFGVDGSDLRSLLADIPVSHTVPPPRSSSTG